MVTLDKKWNSYIDVVMILLSIAFVIISVIAAYFQVKELYPVVGPLVGAICYWIIRLYQYEKNKI